MDFEVATQRLSDEHVSLHDLLLTSAVHQVDDRDGANEHGDRSDSEEGLTTQEQDDAVAGALRERLIKVHAALDRLAAGAYGHSLRSGEVISDERLDADAAAELTAEEAAE